MDMIWWYDYPLEINRTGEWISCTNRNAIDGLQHAKWSTCVSICKNVAFEWSTLVQWEFQDPKLEVLYDIIKAIFWGDIPSHRPYIGLTYCRYLQFRFLKWPLIGLLKFWTLPGCCERQPRLMDLGETLHTTRPIELNSAGSPNLSIAGCRGHKMS